MKKTQRKTRKKRSEKPTISELKKKLDEIFSIWIRKRGMDRFRETNQCFTCGKIDHWKNLQNGHYVSRSYLSLRWDERNCNPQCVGCNVFSNGKMDVYAIKLLAKYGDTILIDLQRAKLKLKRYSIQELQEMIARYRLSTD